MVFGKRKRKSGRQMASAVFPILDEQEALNWQWRVAVKEVGEEEATADTHPSISRSTWRGFFRFCDNDPNTLLEVVEAWGEVRGESFQRRGEEDRADSLAGIHLAYRTGIGNLFGYIPEDHPLSGDPRLANEGRKRGWRS